MKKKRGFVWSELAWWILGLLVLVVFLLLSGTIREKLIDYLEFFGRLFRFR